VQCRVDGFAASTGSQISFSVMVGAYFLRLIPEVIAVQKFNPDLSAAVAVIFAIDHARLRPAAFVSPA